MATSLQASLSKGLDQILSPYTAKVLAWIRTDIPTLAPASILREACSYALLNGGKRFRPALVAMIGHALGDRYDVSPAALAVEYFHTASLVADDLPCMDDDDERRQKPSLHKVYGESTALLVSYGLIAAGYERLAKNAKFMSQQNPALRDKSNHICVLALENATYNTGFCGATGGQFLDINPPDLTIETVREIIHKKTAALFEVSFVCGWLFGGGSVEGLPLVKKTAAHFGMAFQLADDLQDYEQDRQQSQTVNLAVILGKQSALEIFEREMVCFYATLKDLDLQAPELIAIGKLLQSL